MTDQSLAFRLVTRYCLRQRLTPLLDPRSHEVGQRNMRVGVGLGGLCDFEWEDSQLSAWFRICRSEADDYARELHVSRPITVTTVKPSGTISLLNGSSPGIHAPFAPFYLRRVRIAVNDPMANVLLEANVPAEMCEYDSTGHTYVFSFPMKAKHTTVSVQTETIRDQIVRQRRVQENWADNAVSATLSFDAEKEREELASLLKEHVPHLKSTSMLAKTHVYTQPPYEAITEEEFNKRSVGIRSDHQLARGGSFDVDECSSGVCPTR